MRDPYGDFRLINIQGINTEKILADSGGERRSKANDITYSEYDTIILGTSRALRTLDPNHPVFKNRKAYNLSLRGSNIYEIYQVYNYARKKQALKTVVFPLDFLTFTDNRTVSGDFKSSHYSKKLGNILLDIIFNYPQKVAGVSEDFGTIITTKNIEEHLTKIRQAQKQYQIDRS
ncbi:MAG: hypothetical protein QNJ70_28435 [Xenococcaceae cyanobacterium MO_207.B15]|nr:hypothetical protein [Xenococcaceae cyanobacterium MO_207.B15]